MAPSMNRPGQHRVATVAIFGLIGLVLAGYFATWLGSTVLQRAPTTQTEIVGTWRSISGGETLEFSDGGTVNLKNVVVPHVAAGTSEDELIESETARWNLADAGDRVIVVRENGSGFSLHSARTIFQMRLVVYVDADPSSQDRLFEKATPQGG